MKVRPGGLRRGIICDDEVRGLIVITKIETRRLQSAETLIATSLRFTIQSKRAYESALSNRRQTRGLPSNCLQRPRCE